VSALTGARPHRHDGVTEAGTRHAIEAALRDLRAVVPDVVGAIVASVDGLPIADDVPDHDPAGIAAMAATAAGLGKRIVGDFHFGDFAECVVRASGGYFAVYSAGPSAVLAALASDAANLGRLHLGARRCAARIAGALAEGSR
jgi:predicted regulator of Ras-like GTPase activity (Roadblock/LC7/MglB family)